MNFDNSENSENIQYSQNSENINKTIQSNGTQPININISYNSQNSTNSNNDNKLSQNESIPFLIVDAEKFPESRKLAKVDNLPTFATFKNGVLHNQTQTNKAEVLTELVNEVI